MVTKKSKKNRLSVVEKIPVGIEGFNHVSMGGIPKGRTTLLAGSSGAGKTIFAVEFLWRGITENNSNGVFVTFEETPDDICRNVNSLGWNLKKLVAQKKLAFVDASPDITGVDVAGKYDLGALMSRIDYALKKVKAKRIVLDSISAIFTQFGGEEFIRKEIFKISAVLKEKGVTTLLSAERLQEYGDIARFGVEEFVSDNVIILRNILEEENRRRTLEILKFRGTSHQKGEYPYSITDRGVKILPLSAMTLEQRSSLKRISSGNKILDKMCGGGFFRDSIILVSGATGTGKTLMSTIFIDEGCRKKEKTMLFAFEESRQQLTRNALSWGMDFEKWEKKGLLKIICRYPESAGLEDHLISLKDEIELFKPKRIAVDSLSALERVGTAKSFREFVIGLTAHIKTKEIAGFFTNTTPALIGGVSITDSHISTITDSIILLRYVELEGYMKRGITVIKMRGSWHDKQICEYYIDHNGMHIEKVFKGVANIMTGTPSSHVQEEKDKLSEVMG